MKSLTLWALPEPAPQSLGPLILWEEFLPAEAPDNWHSLPDLVHRDRERLRAAYLAWLADLGAPVREHMQIRPGLSYWWMAFPADFSLEPASPAYVVVRLMALARVADELAITTITLASCDPALIEAIKGWARATNRTVSVTDGSSGHSPPGLGGIRARAYRTVPVLAALRVLASHVRIPRRTHRAADTSTGILTFVDYLAHLGPRAQSEGRFDSNYWGSLVELLDAAQIPATWLHISANFATAAVVEDDLALTRRFNQQSSDQMHVLLHAGLTWGVLARACRDYARVATYGRRFASTLTSTAHDYRAVVAGPVLRDAFRDEFFGRTAMLNCLWLNLFERTLSGMPRQELGIYLFENQPWEMAFVHAWRTAGHGRLIGVAHSTTAFWSTRLFKDPRDTWSSEGAAPMPWPDLVAVNGPVMRRICRQAGYPNERMVDAEALRYSALMQPVAPYSPADHRTVLILGEYASVATDHLLDLVAQAKAALGPGVAIRLRPHPASSHAQMSGERRLPLDEHVTLDDAVIAAHVVVCGALSSAAVDAAGRGRPVVVVGDPSILMSSPADGLPGVSYVTTADQLADQFADLLPPQDDSRTVSPEAIAGSYFWLDSGLDRWAGILGLTSERP